MVDWLTYIYLQSPKRGRLDETGSASDRWDIEDDSVELDAAASYMKFTPFPVFDF